MNTFAAAYVPEPDGPIQSRRDQSLLIKPQGHPHHSCDPKIYT